jgi:hypothetical protein
MHAHTCLFVLYCHTFNMHAHTNIGPCIYFKVYPRAYMTCMRYTRAYMSRIFLCSYVCINRFSDMHIHTYIHINIHTSQQNKALLEGGSIFAGTGSTISITGGAESGGASRRSGGRLRKSGGKHGDDAGAMSLQQKSDNLQATLEPSERDAASRFQSIEPRITAPYYSLDRRSGEGSQADGGVDLSQNAARSGGAVSLNGASLTVTGDVSFAGNMATGGNGGGGAVSALSSQLEIDGASFDGNAAKSGVLARFEYAQVRAFFVLVLARVCVCVVVVVVVYRTCDAHAICTRTYMYTYMHAHMYRIWILC